MAQKQQLRTVKKSHETGRLNRDAVRSAVIDVRDSRSSQHNPSDGRGVNAENGRGHHAERHG